MPRDEAELPSVAKPLTPLAPVLTKKRALQESQKALVGDELFLPPVVRKARRVQLDHWARPEAGWRPAPSAGSFVADHDSRVHDAEDSLFAELDLRRRFGGSAARVRAAAAVEDEVESVASDDGADGNMILSPEEAEAKSAIWNEVNKDLLEYWDLKARRRNKERHALEGKLRRRQAQAEMRHRAEAARKEQEILRRKVEATQCRKQRTGTGVATAAPADADATLCTEGSEQASDEGDDAEDDAEDDSFALLDFFNQARSKAWVPAASRCTAAAVAASDTADEQHAMFPAETARIRMQSRLPAAAAEDKRRAAGQLHRLFS